MEIQKKDSEIINLKYRLKTKDEKEKKLKEEI